MGYRSIIDSLKKLLISNRLCDIINSLINKNLVEENKMKKAFQVICCAAGAGMIGFFANQLDTVTGCVFFTLGVALLVGSIILVSKQDKDNK
jgi:hypothetical protein